MGKIAIDSYQFDRVKNFLLSDQFSIDFSFEMDMLKDAKSGTDEASQVISVFNQLVSKYIQIMDSYGKLVKQIVEKYVSFGEGLINTDKAIQVSLYGLNHHTQERNMESDYSDMRDGNNIHMLAEVLDDAKQNAGRD